MKNLIVTLSLIIAGLSVFADNWVFTLNEGSATDGIVTDGVWTFNATINASQQTITFTRVIDDSTTGYAVPTELTAIDFSKSVVSQDGQVAYTIVSLGTGLDIHKGGGMFGYFGAHQDDPKTTAVAKYVGEITFAGEGLTTISDCAFYGCNNMTGTISFPNTLTAIGKRAFQNASGAITWNNLFPESCVKILRSAFQNSSLSGDIVVHQTDFSATHYFRETKITSVKFPSGNVNLKGAWQGGAFYKCTELTNVIFDAEMTGGVMFGGAIFDGCTKLGSLDLRGFTSLGKIVPGYGATYPPLSGSGVTNVMVSSNLSYLDPTFFDGANKLQEVHFYGPAVPSAISAPLFKNVSATKSVTSYVHLDKSDPDYAVQRQGWDAMTDGGKIDGLYSTWSSTYAGDNYRSRFLLMYGEGGQQGELGEWVYDNGVVTNKDWSFNAICAGTSLSIGECTRNPDYMSELIFTNRITNAQGIPLTVVSLNPKFAITTQSTFGFSDVSQHGAEYLGSLVLPTNGLKEIGVCAFGRCVNLTNVWPLLPDSVLTLSPGAFSHCTKLVGSLKLKGIQACEYNIFRGAKISDVEFGQDLVQFNSAWSCASFENCTKLTNIVFDSRAKVSKFYGQTYGPFSGCTKLSGTNGVIDVSCFTKFPDQYKFFPYCPVEMLLFGTNIVEFKSGFLDAQPTYGAMEKLNRIRFLGAPPQNAGFSAFTNLFASAYSSGKLVYPTNKVIRTEVSYKYKDAWLQYAEGGEIKARRTYWKAQYVGGDAFYKTRELCWFDHKDGLLVIVR